jgi:hypothetical protein
MKYKSIILIMCYKIVKVTFYEDTDHHESFLHVAEEQHGDPVHFNAHASQGDVW